jgi:hypothetical protein
LEKADRKRTVAIFERLVPDDDEPEPVALDTEEGKSIAAGLGIEVIGSIPRIESRDDA